MHAEVAPAERIEKTGKRGAEFLCTRELHKKGGNCERGGGRRV